MSAASCNIIHHWDNLVQMMDDFETQNLLEECVALFLDEKYKIKELLEVYSFFYHNLDLPFMNVIATGTHSQIRKAIQDLVKMSARKDSFEIFNSNRNSILKYLPEVKRPDVFASVKNIEYSKFQKQIIS